MDTAYVVVTILSIATLLFSVSGDVFLRERVVANMDRAAVPRSWLPGLAAVRLVGALGLIVGFAVRPVGIAAAVGVVAYFALAIAVHFRARWYAIGYPGTYLVLAAGSLALGLAS